MTDGEPTQALIGKLERVPLREVWKHEAYDFTRWLEGNIDVLNSALDMELVSVECERTAGAFSIDLVAEDAEGNTVVIENQLEKSNHDHLGKLITYLTALNAKAAIWIVSDPRPEHIAAVTWLNTSSSAAFYMVKVEAVRIGNSPAAPIFTVIVGSSADSQGISETKKEIAANHSVHKLWWTQLLELERTHSSSRLHSHLRPKDSSWIETPLIFGGLRLCYVVAQNQCSVDLYIDRGKGREEETKSIFDQLEAHRSEIEASCNLPLSWQRLEGKRACRIRYSQLGSGTKTPEEQWPQIQTDLIAAMQKFEGALRPFVKQLQLAT